MIKFMNISGSCHCASSFSGKWLRPLPENKRSGSVSPLAHRSSFDLVAQDIKLNLELLVRQLIRRVTPGGLRAKHDPVSPIVCVETHVENFEKPLGRTLATRAAMVSRRMAGRARRATESDFYRWEKSDGPGEGLFEIFYCGWTPRWEIV